jgi:hypothetical protein
MKKLIHTLLICFVAIPVFAQTGAGEILNEVVANYQKVKDYQTDVNISTDIPFLKILPMNAKLYFKQPGKMRIVSKGIAILPRQGFDQMYSTITDRNSYMVVPQGYEWVDSVNTAIVNILPASDTMEVIIGKFWIDTARAVILKSQMTTRTNGTVIASYSYGKFASYGLPDRMIFLVDVKKFKIPKAVAVDLNNTNKEATANGKAVRKGKIDIRLSNYIINKGVPDKIFLEKE